MRHGEWKWRSWMPLSHQGPELCWDPYIILLYKEETFSTSLLHFIDFWRLDCPLCANIYAIWMNKISALRNSQSHWLIISKVVTYKLWGRWTEFCFACTRQLFLLLVEHFIFWVSLVSVLLSTRIENVLVLWETQLPLLSWKKCPNSVDYFMKRHGWIWEMITEVLCSCYQIQTQAVVRHPQSNRTSLSVDKKANSYLGLKNQVFLFGFDIFENIHKCIYWDIFMLCSSFPVILLEDKLKIN